MDFHLRIHHYLPHSSVSQVSKSKHPIFRTCRFQWLLGLGRGSVALRLLGLRVPVPARQGCLFLLYVVCVYATDRLLVQKSLTECGVFE
jgi:hypothetical protein